MNTNLTIDDPLAGQEVTIVITVAAEAPSRDERMALVSVGVTGQPPVTKTGPFGQMAALIHRAWMAFDTPTLAAETPDAATQGGAGTETTSAGEITPDTKETGPQPDLSILF